MEFESAFFTTASQKKASNDPSAMPRSFRESGIGDTEARIRYRLLDETDWRPELTGFFVVVFPLQENKRLIGRQHWELSLGALLTKGLFLGHHHAQGILARTRPVRERSTGDYGIEYAKRLSDRWRLVLALDGVQDELEAVAEIQFQVNRRVTIKLNSGFGLTSKAPDFAPEIGVPFSF